MLYIRNNVLATEADVGVVIWLNFAMTNLTLHGFTIDTLLIKSNL